MGRSGRRVRTTPETSLTGPRMLSRAVKRVDAHVEADAAAGFGGEGVGPVEDVAVAAEGHVAGGDVTQHAAVDDVAGGLRGRAEEGIGRGAEVEALFGGKLHQLGGVGQLHRQHLFGVHVFARFEQALDDRVVGGGGGQVDDDFNRFVGQDFVEGQGLEAVFLGRGGGFFGVLVAAGSDVQDLELVDHGGQVGAADAAAADDGGFDGLDVHGAGSF